MVKPFEHWDAVSYGEKIKRVEHLQKALGDMTPHERAKHFDMGSWGKKTPCGTAACAAGQAALQPWFRSRGLKMVPEWDDVEGIEYLTFKGEIGPEYVFGSLLYYKVFVNDTFTDSELPPRKVHARVSKAVAAYLIRLRAELAHENASAAVNATRARFEELT